MPRRGGTTQGLSLKNVAVVFGIVTSIACGQVGSGDSGNETGERSLVQICREASENCSEFDTEYNLSEFIDCQNADLIGEIGACETEIRSVANCGLPLCKEAGDKSELEEQFEASCGNKWLQLESCIEGDGTGTGDGDGDGDTGDGDDGDNPTDGGDGEPKDGDGQDFDREELEEMCGDLRDQCVPEDVDFDCSRILDQVENTGCVEEWRADTDCSVPICREFEEQDQINERLSSECGSERQTLNECMSDNGGEDLDPELLELCESLRSECPSPEGEEPPECTEIIGSISNTDCQAPWEDHANCRLPICENFDGLDEVQEEYSNSCQPEQSALESCRAEAGGGSSLLERCEALNEECPRTEDESPRNCSELVDSIEQANCNAEWEAHASCMHPICEAFEDPEAFEEEYNSQCDGERQAFEGCIPSEL